MAASALLAAASIASLNLCTDEYLLLLAKPQEIVSVSFLSQDPQESSLWRVARGHQALAKVLIATLQFRQDFVRRHLVAFFFTQRVSVDEAAE